MNDFEDPVDPADVDDIVDVVDVVDIADFTINDVDNVDGVDNFEDVDVTCDVYTGWFVVRVFTQLDEERGCTFLNCSFCSRDLQGWV